MADIFAAEGNSRVGYVSDNGIFTAEGNSRVGYVSEKGLPNVALGAAGLLLLGLGKEKKADSSILKRSNSESTSESEGELSGWQIFKKIFLSNPIGLIALGILATVFAFSQDDIHAASVVGIIITAIGILWLVKRNKKEKAAIAAQIPVYLAVLDALKERGYEVNETERKRNHVSSSVKQAGASDTLGYIFIVPPSPSGVYASWRRIEKSHPNEICWPDNGLIIAQVPRGEVTPEKAEWLSLVGSIIQEKLGE